MKAARSAREYDAGRGGGFVKANPRSLELTLSGGFIGNYLEDEPSGYVSLASADKCLSYAAA